MSFADLGLGPEVLRALEESGYVTPTPIQEKAIPHVLMGRDILASAQTGTGKTASFTLPMIEILADSRARARMPRSLILAPTRELAAQIAQNFERYGKYHRLTMALLVGGESMGDQRAALDRGVDVLIATPGRLIDLVERGSVLMTDIKVLVLDECDRMLDMGFIPDIERIVAMLPKRRQTLMFSATLPPEIRRLADAFLDNPREISVAPPASPAQTVTQLLLFVDDEDEKRRALRALIEAEQVRNAFIFCNRKVSVADLNRYLTKHRLNCGALHGDMDQPARTATLGRFKSGEITLLVCSDVAARGLDIQGVSHVFNYDVPFDAEDYVHRIGRTGRAGREGRALTLATQDDVSFLKKIQALIGREIPEVELSGFTRPDIDWEAEDRGRGRRGAKGRDKGRDAKGKDRDGDRTKGRDRDDRNQSDRGRGRSRPEGARFEEPREAEAPAFVGPDAPPPRARRNEGRRDGFGRDEGRRDEFRRDEGRGDEGRDGRRDRDRRRRDDDRPAPKGFGAEIPAFMFNGFNRVPPPPVEPDPEEDLPAVPTGADEVSAPDGSATALPATEGADD